MRNSDTYTNAVSRRMAKTGPCDTTAELRIRRLLHAKGLRYRVDYPVLKGTRRRADIVFTKLKIAIFIDGCFWHGCPDHGTWPKTNADFWRKKIETNQLRDRDTDQRLEDEGWRVIRIWEHEDPSAAAELIAQVVSQISTKK
ncbi:MAG: very short patch repair endonuclease [Candidatus Thiodiazotropha taylori]|nr:very short patch repair endonuclease [Candidatus Thiodiazotropha taylori]